jgi:threonine dehydrogenase-like Zn-dependent dehydrogenase
VDWSVIGDQKELDIHGSHLGPYMYPLAIQYLRDRVVDGGRLVSHALTLDQFSRGIDIAQAGEESIKVVLTS